MSDMDKKALLEKLREEFVLFMQKMMQLAGSPIQKQQAFIRFDEGHMWMQNAVGSYPAQTPSNDEIVPELQQQALPAE